jgi:hypothetical protein
MTAKKNMKKLSAKIKILIPTIFELTITTYWKKKIKKNNQYFVLFYIILKSNFN